MNLFESCVFIFLILFGLWFYSYVKKKSDKREKEKIDKKDDES